MTHHEPDPEWLALVDPFEHEPAPQLLCGRLPKPRPLPEDTNDIEENTLHAVRQFIHRAADTDDILTPSLTAGRWGPFRLDLN